MNPKLRILLLTFCCFESVAYAYNAVDSQVVEFVRQVGHIGGVHCVAITPDGCCVASGGQLDNLVILWDAHTGLELRRLAGHRQSVLSVAFSPNGRLVAAGSSDGTAIIWETRSGKLLKVLQPKGAQVTALAFSRDGTVLATGNCAGWTVDLWDINTGQRLHRFNGHKGCINAMEFAPDGRTMATVSSDCTIRMWDLQKHIPLRTLELGRGTITSLSFSSDGKTLVVKTGWGVYVVSCVSGEILASPVSGGRIVDVVKFSDVGGVLILGCRDGSILVLDSQTYKLISVLPGQEPDFVSVALSADGTHVVSTYGRASIALWETRTEKRVRLLKGNRHVEMLSLDVNDRKGVVAVAGDVSGVAWEFNSGRIVARFGRGPTSALSVAISPNGKLLATGMEDGSSLLWDLQSGALLHSLRVHTYSVNSVVFGHDSEHLLTGASDGGAAVWNCKNGTIRVRLNDASGPIQSVSFGPGDKCAIASSRHAAIWNVASGQRQLQFHGPRLSISPIVFSADGKFVATGSDDKTAVLWDTDTGDWIRTFRGHTLPVRTVAFSDSNRFIATGSEDRTAIIWLRQTGQPLYKLVGHTGAINSVKFILDDQILLTASSDGTVCIWDTSTGRELATWTEFNNGSDWLVYTPDGRFDGSAASWKYVGLRFGGGLDVVSESHVVKKYYRNSLLATILSSKRIERKSNEAEEHYRH